MSEGFVRGSRTPDPKGELELADRLRKGRVRKLAAAPSCVTLDASSSTTVLERSVRLRSRFDGDGGKQDVQSSGRSLVSEP